MQFTLHGKLYNIERRDYEDGTYDLEVSYADDVTKDVPGEANEIAELLYNNDIAYVCKECDAIYEQPGRAICGEDDYLDACGECRSVECFETIELTGEKK